MWLYEVFYFLWNLGRKLKDVRWREISFYFQHLSRRFKNRNMFHVLHWICITGKKILKFDLIKFIWTHFTAQKLKFFTKDFFSKCDQIRRKLRIWSHLLKKSLMENFIFLGSV